MEAARRRQRLEALAEDVLADRQLAADYARKKQENSDALHRLREQARRTRPGSRLATSTLSMGDFFLVVPTATAQDMVAGAQRELEAAIGEVRQRLESNARRLRELQSSA
ncbi:hypothetical protein H4R18_003488 [Coemansia javaensis]|uniref:P53 and DNA damage-regulated protein 1 n=1 Tax=Coemansia javaensis TaxID=2761396 RepID=A0A9W8LIH4_9FUNG|nr:hypothetical protein H4R18_003488 [Coemansia javaensis]